ATTASTLWPRYRTTTGGDTSFGTFTVHGNYTQTANGNMDVYVNGVGAVSNLRVVQENQAGGTATFAQGTTIIFHPDPTSKPGPMAFDSVFATAANNQGATKPPSPANDTWQDVNGVWRSFQNLNTTATTLGYTIG